MITLTIDNQIAEITLNAPEKLNALDSAALTQLIAAYDEAEGAGVRALFLRGEGRGFCAGRDISGVGEIDSEAAGYLEQLTDVLRKITAFPAPTFAAAHGACLGVGLGLLIASDVVYVADNAKFGSPFAALGATLDSGGHALFFERLGAHRALDLIYTGELLSGDEAVSAGLFSRVVPAEELVEFTRERVQKAALGPQQSFAASKRLIGQLRDERIGLWSAIDAESAAQTALSQTEDYREGFAAFREKRPPRFV